MMPDAVRLPTGPAVAFLFTDIEGSTRLEQAIGTATWADLLASHDAILRTAIEEAGGVVVKTEGDAFFAAFADPAAATRAAVGAQRGVARRDWSGEALRVRMGLHLGEGRLKDESDYVGIDVNYAARIAAAANGGQIVLSDVLVRALGAEGPALLGALGDGVEIVDEGPRRVKDFGDPRRLHRLVIPEAADDRRPLRTLEAPSNLPEAATSLVGRETEIALIVDLIARSRIVTLTGPGGAGKTRLAIAAASLVRERFPHGTWFVDLAPTAHAALLEATVAAAIGVRESTSRTVADELREHLRERALLIVLDNLEQLLPDVAARVTALLRDAPGLRVVVTSREVLRVAGEQQFQVPPLAPVEAVNLFVDRARLQRPDFELTDENAPVVRAICERLEGLPLAIELSAARIRLFGVTAIRDRLARSLDLVASTRDVPERQRTLRGAIAWSHDLLGDGERTLFRRLAPFVGGWTAEQAGHVVDPDGTLEPDVLAGLESLADKSLVRIEPTEHGDPRFSHHAVVAEYSVEQLEASGERAACERRHAAAYLALAEAARPHLVGADSDPWLDRLDHERYNLRAAMRWSLDVGEPACGLRIAAAMWRWWHQRARIREGRELLDELLAHPAARADPRARSGALSAAGGLAYWAEDFAAARGPYEERLQLAESLGDPAELASAHYDIGFLSMVERDAERLRFHEERAVALSEQVGDPDGATTARQALVLVAFLAGDFGTARRLEEQNLDHFRTTGSSFRTADSLTLLAAVLAELGEVEQAWAAAREALDISAPRDLVSTIVGALGVSALLMLRHGDREAGARVAGAAQALAREREIATALTQVLHLPDPVELASAILGPDRAAILVANGEAMPLAEILRLAAGSSGDAVRAAARRPTAG